MAAPPLPASTRVLELQTAAPSQPMRISRRSIKIYVVKGSSNFLCLLCFLVAKLLLQTQTFCQLHKPRLRSKILPYRINFDERQPVETFLPRLLEPVERQLSLVKSCVKRGNIKRRTYCCFESCWSRLIPFSALLGFPPCACAWPSAVSAVILSGDDFSAVLNSAMASSSLPPSSRIRPSS